jgi:hypothetical protein
MPTKLKTIPTFLVLGALGVAAWLMAPTFKAATDRQGGPVVVNVDFTPTTRTGVKAPGRQFPDVVVVELTVGGKIFPNEPVTQSPWKRTLYPETGQLVEVAATQIFGTKLECSIVQKGNLPSLQTKNGPAGVRCKLTAI